MKISKIRILGRKLGSQWINGYLKGLGHAILGNSSTDQMVIEVTKIIYENNGSKL